MLIHSKELLMGSGGNEIKFKTKLMWTSNKFKGSLFPLNVGTAILTDAYGSTVNGALQYIYPYSLSEINAKIGEQGSSIKITYVGNPLSFLKSIQFFDLTWCLYKGFYNNCVYYVALSPKQKVGDNVVCRIITDQTMNADNNPQFFICNVTSLSSTNVSWTGKFYIMGSSPSNLSYTSAFVGDTIEYIYRA